MDKSAWREQVKQGTIDTILHGLKQHPEWAEERFARGGTCLHVAVNRGDSELVSALLDWGLSPDLKNEEGRTALHDAIEYGHHKIQQQLLDAGALADINICAILGDEKGVSRWLEKNPKLANDRSTGLSPLGWASFGNQVETARLLVEAGARIDDGELLCAALVAHVEISAFLLDCGLNPNTYCNGRTALHAGATMAYTCEATDWAEYLLKHGANPFLKDHEGQTALDIARQGLSQQQKSPGEQTHDFSGLIHILEAYMNQQEPTLIWRYEFVPDPDRLLAFLQNEVDWDKRMRARLTASYGLPYNYSGIVYPQTEVPTWLQSLCDAVAEVTGFQPNNCLLNYYPDGGSSMGYHSDANEQLSPGTGVAILSLGAERNFQFRRKDQPDRICTYPLRNGSLIYMDDQVQQHWLHAIPKITESGPRISISFRHLCSE
ncbi:MAG: alpha-ketoglutarate-dependent dioxygenase AlkB [Acidobacteria bacterium]|nr:alpha-ketoglutarate-dependent dioxygenase AlkB [Acidobacteriota bacterium]MCB9396627.1 alpha-ketoglutarate-dependent dioxygenase AlkB [Acidobacteriota bacterium]